MLDPRETGPWQMVACADCKREYQCTPGDDHYLRADDPEGSPRVCFACLLRTPTEREPAPIASDANGSDVR